MTTIQNKTVLVTGGSRGLGRGVVAAMLDRGAKVVVVARPSEALDAVGALPGVMAIAADIRDEAAPAQILGDCQPDIVILNAGARPPMGRLDQISWADFTAVWDHDVKAGLLWLQASLNLPLKPGSRVLVVSSGAAISGSQMSGGYGGAKRMLWLMAKYANGVSQEQARQIRFQVVIPRQMILGTGVGDQAAGAYASTIGLEPEAFVTRFGAPMPPRLFGDHVFSILADPQHASGFAFGVNGDHGVSMLEPLEVSPA